MSEDQPHYVINMAGDGELHYRHMTESSDGGLTSRQGTEEEDDEDDLLKEDINQWDIFDDCHKFQ